MPAAVLSLTGSAGRAAAHQRSAHIQQQPARVRSLGDYERIIGLGLGSHGPRWAGTTYIRTRGAARRHDESSAAIESALPPASEPAAVVVARMEVERVSRARNHDGEPTAGVADGDGGSRRLSGPGNTQKLQPLAARQIRHTARHATRERDSRIVRRLGTVVRIEADEKTSQRAEYGAGLATESQGPQIATADLGALDVRPKTSVALQRATACCSS